MRGRDLAAIGGVLEYIINGVLDDTKPAIREALIEETVHLLEEAQANATPKQQAIAHVLKECMEQPYPLSITLERARIYTSQLRLANTIHREHRAVYRELMEFYHRLYHRTAPLDEQEI